MEVKQDADVPECGVWVPEELLQALTAIYLGLRAAAHPRANKQAVFLAEKQSGPSVAWLASAEALRQSARFRISVGSKNPRNRRCLKGQSGSEPGTGFVSESAGFSVLSYASSGAGQDSHAHRRYKPNAP